MGRAGLPQAGGRQRQLPFSNIGPQGDCLVRYKAHIGSPLALCRCIKTYCLSHILFIVVLQLQLPYPPPGGLRDTSSPTTTTPDFRNSTIARMSSIQGISTVCCPTWAGQSLMISWMVHATKHPKSAGRRHRPKAFHIIKLTVPQELADIS